MSVVVTTAIEKVGSIRCLKASIRAACLSTESDNKISINMKPVMLGISNIRLIRPDNGNHPS